MTSLQLVRLIAKAAADKKARGVIRLDVRQRTSLADYFVICEGDTDRQVRAITDSILRACRDQGAQGGETIHIKDAEFLYDPNR